MYSLVRAAELRRFVFRAGRTTSRERAENACERDGILVLPLNPEMVS